MIDDKGMGWIPDKENENPLWYIKQQKKYAQKYSEKLHELMITTSPDKKLYLKDWIELNKKINDEIEKEEGL